MGLDIYFHKVKPSKGTDITSVEALYDDLSEQIKKRFTKKMDELLIAVENATDITARTHALARMRKYVKKVMYYKWYYEKLTPELTNDEIRQKVEQLKEDVYPHEDVYFRKANFVYAFFSPYLVDEECIVTKDMVIDLVDRCNRILSKVNTAKIFKKNGSLVDDFYYKYKKGESWLSNTFTEERKAEEEKRISNFVKSVGLNSLGWKHLAEELLPTQSGFFFGSTNYDAYYLSDIMSCKLQFEKLLKNWKDNEVVYNRMSW